jgi:hypothetical protein
MPELTDLGQQSHTERNIQMEEQKNALFIESSVPTIYRRERNIE